KNDYDDHRMAPGTAFGSIANGWALTRLNGRILLRVRATQTYPGSRIVLQVNRVLRGYSEALKDRSRRIHVVAVCSAEGPLINAQPGRLGTDLHAQTRLPPETAN